MISVIVPTFNSAACLPATLESLIPAAVAGLVREVLIVDGGSSDVTLNIADGFGATIASCGPQRADRLRTGAQLARFPWMLVIDPGCVPNVGWEREADQLMHRIDEGLLRPCAAVFDVAREELGVGVRTTEHLARWSSMILGLAHAHQGLLISRALYGEVGGYRTMPVFESIDLSRRIGRARLVRLRTTVQTNAATLSQLDGANRTARYYGCIALFLLQAPHRRLSVLLRQPPAAFKR